MILAALLIGGFMGLITGAVLGALLYYHFVVKTPEFGLSVLAGMLESWTPEQVREFAQGLLLGIDESEGKNRIKPETIRGVRKAMGYPVPVILLALTLAAASAGAFQCFQSGNEILAHLEKEDSFSTGYSAGVIDTLHYSQEIAPTPYAFCSPASITQGQVAKVAEKWLKANPEKLHLSAPDLLESAFITAWPCPAD